MAREQTVLIVDDHFVVRSGLVASLELDDAIKELERRQALGHGRSL